MFKFLKRRKPDVDRKEYEALLIKQVALIRKLEMAKRALAFYSQGGPLVSKPEVALEALRKLEE